GPLEVDELQTHGVTVQLQVVVVMDVRLDRAPGASGDGEGGVGPDGDGRGGPGQRGDVGMVGVLDDGEVTGVDAVGRDQPSGLRTEVRGGEAELTTTLVPSVDDLGDGVEPAQHPGGLAHLTLQQGLTDGGGGDAPAV